jgi:hypothetical protein
VVSQRDTFPSGVKPDAMDDEVVYLFKACSRLRLTRQIRMATVMASQTGRRLQLRIRVECVLSPDLADFVRENAELVSVARA